MRLNCKWKPLLVSEIYSSMVLKANEQLSSPNNNVICRFSTRTQERVGHFSCLRCLKTQKIYKICESDLGAVLRWRAGLSKWVTHTTVSTPEIHRLCSKLLITLMVDDWSHQTKLLSYIVMNRLPRLLEVEACMSIRPVTMTRLWHSLQVPCNLIQGWHMQYCRISQHLINCRIYYIKLFV